MREEADACTEFVARRSFNDFVNDRQLRYAVERAIQRLTEAAFRLGDDGPELLPNINWREVRGLGNILRHEYDQVEDLTVWHVATQDVPDLRRRIVTLLSSEQEGNTP